MATTKIIPGVLDLNEATSESGLKIPTGTNNNRPATDVAGMVRNNTNETSNSSASCEEYYNGAAWKKINNVAIPPPQAFKTVIWTGNGTSQSITGVGFQPDWVWGKERSNTSGNELLDSTRGATNYLTSNSNGQQATSAQGLQSFDSDGFTVGNDGAWNQNGETYVAWCWKANGGTTSSNTDGTITSTVQANQDAGFSIVKYTGNGNTSQESFGHGLSSTPELIIQKSIDTLLTYGTNNWVVGGTAVGSAGSWLELNTTDAKATDSSYWGNQLPSSTVVYISGSVERVHNESGKNFINYCFHSVSGFSKIGSYSGTGVNGNNITVGFQPNWLMVKRTNATDNWVIVDSERGTNNSLFPDLSSNELSNSGAVTFTSTGFTVNGASGGWNNGSSTYLYMALKTN